MTLEQHQWFEEPHICVFIKKYLIYSSLVYQTSRPTGLRSSTSKYFRETLHHRCLSGFWIYKGFEWVSGSKYAHAVNITGFWKKKGSEYARIVQDCEYVWKVLKYAQICLNILEYTWICLNLPEWLLFYILSL